MVGVRRLVTTVDLADTEARSPQEASVSALHEAELTDGSRVVLLGDRGFTWQVRVVRAGDPGADPVPPAELPGAWEHDTVAGLKHDARVVVGPDEPYDDDVTFQHMEATHWEHLAAVLAERGVQVEPERLAVLAHDVELTDRVLARISEPPPG